MRILGECYAVHHIWVSSRALNMQNVQFFVVVDFECAVTTLLLSLFHDKLLRASLSRCSPFNGTRVSERNASKWFTYSMRWWLKGCVLFQLKKKTKMCAAHNVSQTDSDSCWWKVASHSTNHFAFYFFYFHYKMRRNLEFIGGWLRGLSVSPQRISIISMESEKMQSESEELSLSKPPPAQSVCVCDAVMKTTAVEPVKTVNIPLTAPIIKLSISPRQTRRRRTIHSDRNRSRWKSLSFRCTKKLEKNGEESRKIKKKKRKKRNGWAKR